jgi:AmpD protein
MINQHWLTQANKLPSANHNKRPNMPISLVVIHNISLPPNEFNNPYIEDFFTNCLDTNAHPYFKKIQGLQVCAHLLIKRTGAITQFVPFNKRAWHAGESSYQNQKNCNDFSIGIELEGTNNIPYTDLQYLALNQALDTLKLHYPIQKIVGHSDIAPGRKTDPGQSFDWSKLK